MERHDPGEYRASVDDNYGHVEILSGHIDGDLLTFESIGSPPVRLRLSWQLVDEATMVWRNEVAVQGGPFELVERYVCTSIK